MAAEREKGEKAPNAKARMWTGFSHSSARAAAYRQFVPGGVNVVR
jgi:hypothetical protein